MTTNRELSPDELEEMFNSIDADHNGNLSREEIKELVKFLKRPPVNTKFGM